MKKLFDWLMFEDIISRLIKIYIKIIIITRKQTKKNFFILIINFIICLGHGIALLKSNLYIYI